ncbi:MAG: EAL domain-containing protein [Frankiaceae bacterium]|nr:EAL domain-containing protein [Frankiaceae bacterium]
MDGLELVRLELVRQQLVRLELVRQQLVRLELVRQQLVRLELVRLELVRLELVRQQLVRLELVRQQLVCQRLDVRPRTGNRGLTAFCLLTGAVGVATLVAALAADPALPSGAQLWLFLGFAVALTAAELYPFHLTHEAQSEALRLEEAFFVPMAVLLPPAQTLVVIAIAMAVASATSARRSWLKGSFNVGMMTTSAAVGLAVSRLPWPGGALTGAAVGGLLFCAISALWVSGVLSIAQGERWRTLVLDGIFVRVATWLGSLSLGLLATLAARNADALLLVAVVPLVVLQFAYQSALKQWRERRNADALYDAAARIHRAVESDEVRAQLVAAAGELLAAGSVAILPADSTVAAGSMAVVLDDESTVVVGERATGGHWSSGDEKRLQALTAVARGALTNALLFEQMQAITRSLGEGVLALDERGIVTFANPAAESLLGWRRGELVGREIAESVDPDSRDDGSGNAEWVHLPRLRAGETLRIDEHVVTRSDGSPLDVALTASPVLRDGDVVGAVVVFRDVRDRKTLERRLVHQAFHDPLTGLPNRALFLDRLEHARARSLRDGGTQAVLFIDLDRFKVINDSLGHRTGDQVLQTIASRLVGVLRPSDTVSRFGGDEFTVLLEQVVDASEAAQTAERILRALQLPMEAADRDVVITASIGIAIAEPGNAPGDLLAAADIAMYQAKSRGKNRYVVAAADADERALARLDLEMQLRRAIDDGELEVHYQPVVEAKTGQLYGLEALVRWRHPTLGLLGPAHFMDVAEDTGLVLPLGDWVLEQACIAGVDWQRRHPDSPVVMAVNLSARQFQQPDLCDRVAQVLNSTGLEPNLLALEITETVVMEDTTATLATLRKLKQLKVRLSIDDFGTGYSSLSYLKRFPVDAVKIDKSFVDGLASGPVDREIVRAVIRLATAVGMQTIAEGVETTAQCEQLRLLGCTMLQGFLLSRPGSLEEVERLVAPGPAGRVPAPRGGGVRVRLG